VLHEECSVCLLWLNRRKHAVRASLETPALRMLLKMRSSTLRPIHGLISCMTVPVSKSYLQYFLAMARWSWELSRWSVAIGTAKLVREMEAEKTGKMCPKLSWRALGGNQVLILTHKAKTSGLFRKKYTLSKIYFTITTDAKSMSCVWMERKSLKVLIWISS
jgi:hypothetical protein